jgi:hypothetical protein
MCVESDFFHDHKIKKFRAAFFLSLFELIAVSVFKSSLSPAAYILLCRKFFNVNKSKQQKHDKSKK